LPKVSTASAATFATNGLFRDSTHYWTVGGGSRWLCDDPTSAAAAFATTHQVRFST